MEIEPVIYSSSYAIVHGLFRLDDMNPWMESFFCNKCKCDFQGIHKENIFLAKMLMNSLRFIKIHTIASLLASAYPTKILVFRIWDWPHASMWSECSYASFSIYLRPFYGLGLCASAIIGAECLSLAWCRLSKIASRIFGLITSTLRGNRL